MTTDRNHGFGPIEGEDDDRRPAPSAGPRIDLLGDVLRRRAITEAEDESLADPFDIWKPIRGGHHAS